MARHEIIAEFCGVRPGCQWPVDDGSNAVTIIGEVQIEGRDGLGLSKIKGQITPNELTTGLTYRFYGDWKDHWKHGTQFVFEAFSVEMPSGQDAIIAYLGQCKGIGPMTAAKMWHLYGENAVQKLREEPDEVAHAIPRLTQAKAREAAEFLRRSQRTEKTKIDLFALLRGRGFPKKITERLIQDYGPAAAVIVARNPYCLMRYKGCGFLGTDKMYLDLKHNPGRLKRQALCAWHAVASQSSGDTWFPFHVVRDGLIRNIASATVNIPRAMELATRGGMLVEKFDKGQRWVAERVRAEQESTIASLIEEARQEAKVTPPVWTNLVPLIADVTNHQRENLEAATTEIIGVLAGRPGTGKTYTVARLVKLLQDQYGADEIAICAPTGKAAVRVTEAMNKNGLSLRASTIHSLLKVGSTADGEFGFLHTRNNPFPYKFVIVDESSMIDTGLMKSLLDARPVDGHVLFVGDPNQLSPVGHGAPLRDFITANVAHGELKEIQRNSGRIVKACGEIIDRHLFECSPKADLETGENLVMIERADAANQMETLVQVIQRYAAEMPRRFDPVWDIQVLVAVNKKSELGRKPLNVVLQNLLNSDGESVKGNPFRVGDKIICTKNGNYKWVGDFLDPAPPVEGIDAAIEPSGSTMCYVANGEQAEVLTVEPGVITARLTSPDRTIIIPRSMKSGSTEGSDGAPPASSDTGTDDDGDTGSGCNWELGYAISCHKSQGSEWPIVVVMLDDHNSAKRVCSRQWIYTGISRAKTLCVMIGRNVRAQEMCGVDSLFKRKTFLREAIIELREAGDAEERNRWAADVVDELLAGVY